MEILEFVIKAAAAITAVIGIAIAWKKFSAKEGSDEQLGPTVTAKSAAPTTPPSETKVSISSGRDTTYISDSFNRGKK